MKKIISILLIVLFTLSAFAVSYKNNTYQKLADEYTKKAENALDSGQFDDAVEYSKKAEENAELSRAYIQMMIARGDAEKTIKLAKNELARAESVDAANTFPMAYTSAKENLTNAESVNKTINKIEIIFFMITLPLLHHLLYREFLLQILQELHICLLQEEQHHPIRFHQRFHL